MAALSGKALRDSGCVVKVDELNPCIMRPCLFKSDFLASAQQRGYRPNVVSFTCSISVKPKLFHCVCANDSDKLPVPMVCNPAFISCDGTGDLVVPFCAEEFKHWVHWRDWRGSFFGGHIGWYWVEFFSRNESNRRVFGYLPCGSIPFKSDHAKYWGRWVRVSRIDRFVRIVKSQFVKATLKRWFWQFAALCEEFGKLQFHGIISGSREVSASAQALPRAGPWGAT